MKLEMNTFERKLEELEAGQKQNNKKFQWIWTSLDSNHSIRL